MECNKKGTNNQLRCEVCKIDFASIADSALHEFTKKHCDNLLRVAKNKPVVTKQKAKSKVCEVKKEPAKINVITHTGSIAKYGYFIPGGIYNGGEVTKEFNTDYDPYVQKFAESSSEEKPLSPPPPPPAFVLSGSQVATNISKKKRKKIKTCQICNLTLPTVSKYDAHMRSAQHIWKLKVSGIGVSAHFVKASTDLHTTDINEESKPPEQVELPPLDANIVKDNSTGPFPLLYCHDCELLLNSPQQYNAHVVGKSHIECAQKKADLKAKKEKLLTPTPNQLYCYTCKICLNNLFQYKEHKNGKKHKAKCKQLIEKGVTIPPEERVPGLVIPKVNPSKPVVYPELYEKYVLEKQKQDTESVSNDTGQQVEALNCKILSGAYFCDICNLRFVTMNEYNYHNSSIHCQSSSGDICVGNTVAVEKEKADDLPNKPNIVFHGKTDNSLPLDHSAISNSELVETQPENQTANSQLQFQPSSQLSSSLKGKSNSHLEDQMIIVGACDPLVCNICLLNFNWQAHFDIHFGSEEHLKKILELKTNGKTDAEILQLIFTDRSRVKPDNFGKLSCSICSVTADNMTEFDQHLKSIVHKYTLKDYRKKRTIEVKHLVPINDLGLYFCKLCKEGWNSLVDFTQHFHLAKHKSMQSAEKAKKILAKRRAMMAQKQRLAQRNRKLKIEKNPGVRTKICGVATNLQTGAQASIPNLEQLEPKIDPAKNVNIGVSEKANDKVAKIEKKMKKRRRGKVINRNIQQKSMVAIPPLIPPSIMQQPLCLSPSPSQFMRPSRQSEFLPSRHWSPYQIPYSRNFYGRPPVMGPPPCSPCFSRPRFPRFVSGYR